VSGVITLEVLSEFLNYCLFCETLLWNL